VYIHEEYKHTTTDPVICAMGFEETEERPAKKRRFFVEDSPTADDSVQPEASTLDGNNASPPITPPSSSINGVSDGFDVGLLNGIAGEDLPASIVDKLKRLSGNNIERGRTHSLYALDKANTEYSHQHLSGRILEH